MDHKVFEKILTNEEYVIKTYKPYGKRVALGCFFYILWPVLSIAAMVGIFLLLKNSLKDEFAPNLLPLFLFFGIYILFLFFVIFSMIANSIKIRYAVTNKRLIMRKGAFSERFICIDFTSINSKVVKCGVLDKWVHPNTGRLIYSSNSPLVTTLKSNVRNNNATQLGLIVFSYIENPFESFKYINSLIDQAKLEGNL